MKIVINSHVKSGIALSHLMKSMMLQQEFGEFEFIIVIGGFYHLQTYETQTSENITTIKCNHNSIDFTALIALAELYGSQEDEYYFYLHDTCKVGSNFYKKLKAIDVSGVSSMKIVLYPSMNIGLYSQRILNKFKPFLLEHKNTNESRTMDFKIKAVELEDYIFKNDPTNTTLENNEGYSYYHPEDYYKTGVIRRVEYYSNIDLYKIKANWVLNSARVLDN